MSAQATCAWGEGPDVLVTVDRHNASGFGWTKFPERSPSGWTSEGSFGVTIDEALALATQLAQAAVHASKLQGGYAQAGRSLEGRGAPVGSHDAKEVRGMVLQFARERGCVVRDDECGNLIIVLPGGT